MNWIFRIITHWITESQHSDERIIALALLNIVRITKRKGLEQQKRKRKTMFHVPYEKVMRYHVEINTFSE